MCRCGLGLRVEMFPQAKYQLILCLPSIDLPPQTEIVLTLKNPIVRTPLRKIPPNWGFSIFEGASAELEDCYSMTSVSSQSIVVWMNSILGRYGRRSFGKTVSQSFAAVGAVHGNPVAVSIMAASCRSGGRLSLVWNRAR